MHLQRLADVGIEDYRSSGIVYLERFCEPWSRADVQHDGLGTVGTGGGNNPDCNRRVGRWTVPNRCVCDRWFKTTCWDQWANIWGDVLEDGGDDECGLP